MNFALGVIFYFFGQTLFRVQTSQSEWFLMRVKGNLTHAFSHAVVKKEEYGRQFRYVPEKA